MRYIEQLRDFQPGNPREAADRQAILAYAERDPERTLTREDDMAHITSSGFIMNPALDKVLFAHHNILKKWAWSGGHADGDGDLSAVALREAREETGLLRVRLLFSEIASVDILTVPPHWKNGAYVHAHLHLSVSFLLIAEEDEALHVKPDENSGVCWFPVDYISEENFSENDMYLYHKHLKKAEAYKSKR